MRASSWGAKSKSYIEVEPGDIALANRLANEAMGRKLSIHSPARREGSWSWCTRWCRQNAPARPLSRGRTRFSRREVRLFTGWSDFQVKMHMKKLEELEYVLIHRGGRGQSFVYELLYRGEGQDEGSASCWGSWTPSASSATTTIRTRSILAKGWSIQKSSWSIRKSSWSPQGASKEIGRSPLVA